MFWLAAPGSIPLGFLSILVGQPILGDLHRGMTAQTETALSLALEVGPWIVSIIRHHFSFLPDSLTEPGQKIEYAGVVNASNFETPYIMIKRTIKFG